MFPPSRRAFLAVIGASPIGLLLAEQAAAQVGRPRVRYDARSPKGIEMLSVYASAVRKMNDATQIPQGDPRSWLFQWYTHWVNDQTSKEAEIARLYPNPNDPNRAAAEAMWNTCQAHGLDQDEDNFLPWHRLFVFYFERIIASVSQRPDFALPYWNYSTTVVANRGVIPPQFRMKDDPTFGSLFDGLRNPGVNNGQPIQAGRRGDPLSLDALEQAHYSPAGVQTGFNQKLDQGLHGAVHVLVGGGQNMGNVPTAARDPIFWMHHCNIDRLWASWNAAGRVNPSITGEFTFFDAKDGKTVSVDLSKAMNMANFDYAYDRLEPVPNLGRRIAPMMAPMNATPLTEVVAAAADNQSIRLGADATSVALAPAPRPVAVAFPAAAPVNQTITERVENIEQGESVYLVASDLSANAQPGVLYDLFIDLPANATEQDLEDHRIGTINFFGIAHPGGGHGRMMAHGEQMKPRMRSKFVSFDVTGKVRALGRTGRIAERPVLTIIPQGQPIAAAQPVIGKVGLVVQ